MSTLHTVSKPPSSGLLSDCLSVALPGDAILLIEDGVYCTQQPASLSHRSEIKVYCLREDLIARGLGERKLGTVETVNTAGFVDLCAEHRNCLNWF